MTTDPQTPREWALWAQEQEAAAPPPAPEAEPTIAAPLTLTPIDDTTEEGIE
jgi:hypothetical protein